MFLIRSGLNFYVNILHLLLLYYLLTLLQLFRTTKASQCYVI